MSLFVPRVRELALVLLITALLAIVADSTAWGSEDSSKNIVVSEPALSLADLPTAAQETQTLIRRIGDYLTANRLLLKDSALTDILQSVTPKLEAMGGRQQFAEANLAKLVELNAEVSANSVHLNQLTQKYRSAVLKDEESLDGLDLEQGRWSKMLALARERKAPAEVLSLAERTLTSLNDTRSQLIPDRNLLLKALAKATEVRFSLDSLNAEIAQRRDVISRAIMTADREPLLDLDSPNQERFQDALKAFRNWSASLIQYLAEYWLAIIGIVLTLGAGAWYLSTCAMSVLDAQIAQRATRIMRKPVWLILFVVALGLNFAPQGPIAFYDVIWLLILVPLIELGQEMHGPRRWMLFYAVGIAILPLPFRTIFETLPWIDRWLLNIKAVLLCTALFHDWRSAQTGWADHHRGSLIKTGVLAFSSALLLGVAANFAGRTGIAKEVINGSVGSLGFLLIYSVAKEVGLVLFAGLLGSPIGKMLRMVRTDTQTLLHAAQRTLCLIALCMTIAGALYAFRMESAMHTLMINIWETTLEIGNVKLSVKSILVFMLMAAGTILLVRIASFLLEKELLPRLRLPAGIPFAITTVTRYSISLLGIVLSMLALGIDLTQVSILAGALGVGVGFGLQNIFNNFISGLILLFERPIHVGDVIEVGGALRGGVTRIGVRSSTIRTTSGAEVIVPNGDLIAKEVINWTLSDRRRRIDITVGVAYGTSIAKMLDVLVEVAHHTDGILDDPEPTAFFSNFGESSLDFTLYGWLERYEDNLMIASRLRLAISEKLASEGIEIPYPQRDIHIIGKGQQQNI